MGWFDKAKELITSVDSPFTPDNTDNYQDFTNMLDPVTPENKKETIDD
jgi:hypothetical protein